MSGDPYFWGFCNYQKNANMVFFLKYASEVKVVFYSATNTKWGFLM